MLIGHYFSCSVCLSAAEEIRYKHDKEFREAWDKLREEAKEFDQKVEFFINKFNLETR